MKGGTKQIIPNSSDKSEKQCFIQWVALAIVGGAIGFCAGWYVWGLASINTYFAALVALLLAVRLRNGIRKPPVVWGRGRNELGDG